MQFMKNKPFFPPQIIFPAVLTSRFYLRADPQFHTLKMWGTTSLIMKWLVGVACEPISTVIQREIISPP